MCKYLCMGLYMYVKDCGCLGSEFGIAESMQGWLDRGTLFVCIGGFVFICVCMRLFVYVCM